MNFFFAAPAARQGKYLGPLYSVFAGSNIGNMTANGGLAQGFDGTTNQAAAASPGVGGASGYIGKTLTKPVFQAVVYGTNDFGYNSGGNPSVTITLYGKQGSAPANGTDGTSLGSVTFTDTSNESGNPRTIVSNDPVTKWDHVWVNIVTGAADALCAELQLYESIG